MATLPQAVAALQQHWGLTLDAPFQPGGQTAWVAPAHTTGRDDLVLKVGWRHTEAAYEADGLRVWVGQGAVQLHAVESFDDSVALLLERCVPGTTLACRPEPERDTVIASLLPQLWRDPPPDHPFRPLQHLCQTWAKSRLRTGSCTARAERWRPPPASGR